MIRSKQTKLLIFVLLVTSSFGYGQGRYNEYKKHYLFSVLAKKYSKTFGIALFPKEQIINTGLILNLVSRENQKNNGIYIELLGNGLIDVFAKNGNYAEKFIPDKSHSNYNGFSFSPLGINSNGKVNGLTINGLCLIQTELNGLGLSLGTVNLQKSSGLIISGINSNIGTMSGFQISIHNHCIDGKGVSIGLANFADEYHGVLIGFINQVDMKIYPIIYFNFKNN